MPISGSFRHLASIRLNGSTALDSYGRETIVESTIATVKGSLMQLTGTEREIANQEFGAVTHQFKCWYVPNITNKCWLMIDGNRFNVVNVNDVNNKKFELDILLASETS